MQNISDVNMNVKKACIVCMIKVKVDECPCLLFLILDLHFVDIRGQTLCFSYTLPKHATFDSQ